MKKSIKLLLLLLLFSFVNCQKEDSNMVLDRTIDLNWHYRLGGKTLLTIDAQDIPKILQTIADQRKGYFPNLEPNTNGRDLDVNNPFGIVDESNIMALEDEYGYRTYTFKISPYTTTENMFYNLIVTADADGTVINSYIKKYKSFNNESPGPTYNGKNSKYELDGTLIHQVTFTQGRGVAPDCEPCIDPDDNSDSGDNNGGTDDGDINDTNDDPNDNSNDSGGGGGDNNSGDPGDNGNPSDTSDTSDGTNGDATGDGGNTGGSNNDGPCGGGPQVYSDCTRNYLEFIEVDGVIYEITVDCCGIPIVSRSTNSNPLESRTEETPLPCCDEDVVVLDDQEDVCAKLNDLLANTQFAAALSNIKADANSDSERGFEISRDNNGNISTNFVQGGFRSVKLKSGGNIIGGLHNHTQEYGNPMFSGQDILALLFFYLRNSNPNKVPSDAFLTLTIQTGPSTTATYAITIDSFATLSSLINAAGISELDRLLRNAYNKTIGVQNETKYTGGLLRVLKKLGTEKNIPGNALNLYKLNDDGTAFEKITLDNDNNPTQPQPCN